MARCVWLWEKESNGNKVDRRIWTHFIPDVIEALLPLRWDKEFSRLKHGSVHSFWASSF
jgi:hypothetical protein